MPDFHAEIKRVPKINDPLLVIGLGGTGTDALLHIMRKFKSRFILPTVNGEVQDRPERTAYLAVDSDMENLNNASIGDSRLKQGDKLALHIPDMGSLISNPPAMQACEKSWWDTNIPAFKAGFGAGSFRQVGRLLLFRNVPMIVSCLVNTIGKLLAVERNATGGSLTVVITTGIGGGTGSGTFLDMAYLIRHVMRTQFCGVKFNIMAYIIMPGVNLAHINHPSPAIKQKLKTNSFAALKELDFWMNYDAHGCTNHQVYSADIECPWDSKPFNNVVLLSEERADGTVFSDPYNVVMDLLAESLLNFFAAEQSIALDGAFSYQIHSANIAAEAMAMDKAYPVNYAYMSMGAAISEAQQDNMVVYEAKLTFDEVMKLQKADSLLGTRKADEFFNSVLPEDEDLFQLYENECPLPPYFHGETGYNPKGILSMQGDLAIHGQPYRSFDYDVDTSAKGFAKERAEIIYRRFQETVRSCISDPACGPFVIEEMLRDSEKGFISRFHAVLQWWQNEKEIAENENAHLLNLIANAKYPDMQRINKLETALKMFGKVTGYVQSCERLYTTRRDFRLAGHMAEELRRIESKIVDYSTVILSAFCALLKQVHMNLTSEVGHLLVTRSSNEDMINFPGLKAYIDQQMLNPNLSYKMNMAAHNILKELADASLSVSLDATQNLEDWENLQKDFLASANTFVNDSFEDVNSITMDQLFSITMPSATEREKISYVTDMLMPSLQSAAQTMLKLIMNCDGLLEYSYVSVPEDAQIVRAGLEEFSQTHHITPKYSKINDRVYWLNTLNRVPMYRYADLIDLETSYENALDSGWAFGLHLVQVRSHTPSFQSDWSLLPSPIPHLLLGKALSKRQAKAAQSVTTLLNDALQSKFAVLTKEPRNELLSVRILTNENGTLMEPEAFREQVDIIANDGMLPYADRLDRLNALRDNGKPVEIRYRDFTATFANAMGLMIEPQNGTMAEKWRAEEAEQAARLAAAHYVMMTQHPDIVEQMAKQREVYGFFTLAIQQLSMYNIGN